MPENNPFKALTERLDINFALRAAGLGVWELDPITNLVNWDDRCRELFGLAKDNTLPYERAIQHIHPDDMKRVDGAVRWVMNPQSGGNYDVTYRTIGADDGRLRWVRFVGRSYFNEAGDVYRFAGVAQDVTKDVETQQVRASEAHFRSLVEQAPVAMAIFRGPDHIVETVNEAHLQLWGRRAEQVLGKPLFEALPEVKGLGYEELLANVLITGEPFHAHELSAPLVRNGQLETVYFNFVYQPLRETDGTITAVTVVANEITEQVLARQRIEESEAKFRTLIEETPVATCLFVGRDLVIEVANELMIRFFGKGRSILGKPVWDVLTADREQSAIQLLERVLATGEPFVATGAPSERTVDGLSGTYYFDISLKPLRNAAGAVYAILETAVDVTEPVLARQKLEESEQRYRLLSAELEQQIQQRTRELATANEQLAAANEELAAMNEELTTSNEELLTSNQATVASNEQLWESNHNLTRSNDNLEKFAYVASHDLQEPLRKIQQFGDILKTQHADQLGDGVLYLERMQSAAGRMSTLIRDLLTFSRVSTQQDSITSVSLDEVLDSVRLDLELRIQETGATVETDTLPVARGDRSQLEQLFQNLLSNALKFRRPDANPAIYVRYRVVAYAELPASVKPTRMSRQYHRIDVTDNGIGFDDKYVDRIFEVFQRLHGRNQYTGTGIGLAICERVAANHGGAITATSQPGQGATFSVYLPT